jgi:hypothetical protein
MLYHLVKNDSRALPGGLNHTFSLAEAMIMQ